MATIHDTNLNDIINGTSLADTIFGNGGSDRLVGSGRGAVIHEEARREELVAGREVGSDLLLEDRPTLHHRRAAGPHGGISDRVPIRQERASPRCRASGQQSLTGWPAQFRLGQLTLIRRGIAFSAFGSTSVITPSFNSALIPSCSILLEI